MGTCSKLRGMILVCGHNVLMNLAAKVNECFCEINSVRVSKLRINVAMKSELSNERGK